MISKERKRTKVEILGFYLEALMKTKAVPYQVLAYCYAVLIPNLFKTSSNSKFLKQIDVLSGRDGKAPNSHYNVSRNCVEGEVARKSIFLVDWAIGVMDGQKVEELDREFLELYGMTPLTEDTFIWGEHYRQRMDEIYREKGIPVRKIVITDCFQRNAIKNWPQRIAVALYRETEKIAHEKRDFR